MRRVGMAMAMLASGCLELNPSYVDDDPELLTDTGGMTDASSTTAEPAECQADAYDPNTYEEPADATALSLVELRLEGVDDADHYKAWVDPMAPAEVFARTPGVDLRVCLYAECDGLFGATITKCAGEAATSPTFIDGCCATRAVGLEFDCMGVTGIMAHVQVDGGGDTCPGYDLEIGSNLL